jgi:microcystin-dependent protein
MKRVVTLASALALLASAAYAQSVPSLINYQGTLNQASGAPVENGTYTISFRLYNSPTAGTLVWGRTYDVTVANGQFNVILGASGGTTIPALVTDVSRAFDGSARYLGIAVETDGTGTPLASPEEIAPRQQILSTPYALNAQNGVPPGTLLPFAGSADIDQPLGYIPCDGREVSRTKFANLFAAIGTIWGEGDGSTTFNVPDMRGRGPIGAGQGAGLTDRSLGDKGGEETHKLSVDEMPKHTHDGLGLHTHLWRGFRNASGSGSGESYRSRGEVKGDPEDEINRKDLEKEKGYGHNHGPQGGDQAHNNMPPFSVVNYIIRY